MKKKLRLIPFEPYDESKSRLEWICNNIHTLLYNGIVWICRSYIYELNNLKEFYDNTDEFKNATSPIAGIANVNVKEIKRKENFHYKIEVMDDSYEESPKLNAFRKSGMPIIGKSGLDEEQWEIVTSLKKSDNITIFFNPQIFKGELILKYIKKHRGNYNTEYSGLDEILKKNKIKVS